MGEELTSGPPERPSDRPRSWWLRSWPRLGAGVVVLLAIGWLIAPRLIDQHSGVLPSPRPNASSGSTSTDQASPDQASTDQASTEQLLVRPRLDGPTAEPPAGLLLAVGGPRPAASGAPRDARATSLAEALKRVPLGKGEAVAAVSTVPGGLLVEVQIAFISGDEPSERVYLVRDSGIPLLLARADEVAIGHTWDRIFALRYGPGWQGPSTLTQVSWAGRVLASHSAPERLSLQADGPAGLLVTLASANQGPSQLELLDPGSLRVTERLGQVDWVVAATAKQAAWTSSGCLSACRLTVAELPDGPRQSIPMPDDSQPGAAEFSPDGRRLAVAYLGRHPEQVGGPAPGFVDVIDLKGGTSTRIPGVATGIKQAAELAWTPDGADVALSVGFPDTDIRRVGLWPVTGGPVRVLPRAFSGAYAPSALIALPSARL